jgi:NADH:ubiquinone oxidoreductase subunit E
MNIHVAPSAMSDALTNILARWSPVGRSGLLPALIEAQEAYGWLSEETLTHIANGLGVPLSEAFGVADFYAHLYTHPVGKKFVRVCDDVPCYLAGSEKICAAVEQHLQIHADETTADGALTYEIVPCLGHCDHAPVVMVGSQVHENITAEGVKNLLT